MEAGCEAGWLARMSDVLGGPAGCMCMCMCMCIRMCMCMCVRVHVYMYVCMGMRMIDTQGR
jgi:hypothetical protein